MSPEDAEDFQLIESKKKNKIIRYTKDYRQTRHNTSTIERMKRKEEKKNIFVQKKDSNRYKRKNGNSCFECGHWESDYRNYSIANYDPGKLRHLIKTGRPRKYSYKCETCLNDFDLARNCYPCRRYSLFINTDCQCWYHAYQK